MKVLVLVIASFDKPVYYDMFGIWKKRINELTDGCMTDGCMTDVWFIQCKSDKEWIGDIVNDIEERSSPMTPPLSGQSQSQSVSDFESLGSASLGSASLGSASLGSASLKERFELDILNKTLFVRGDECLIPGILHKTVEAISFFLSYEKCEGVKEGFKGNVVPFIWRTNLSSVLDFHGLERYLGTICSKGFYGGYIGKVSDIFFASGAGFLMSRDVAEYLVLNKGELRYDLIDDVAIGALLEPRFGIVPIDRCWIQTGDEDILAKGVFHFRCESYQHLRTVEFMQFVGQTYGPASLTS